MFDRAVFALLATLQHGDPMMTPAATMAPPTVGTAGRVAATIAGHVETALQPIVDLTTGSVVGVESLARFSDARSPEAWFAEADSVGLGLDLELAFVRAGLARLAELPPHAYITLNVSPAAAASPELAEALTEAPRGRVVLEITEHSAVVDYPSLEHALDGFRYGGVRIAVDDAGAGFASLRHVLLLHPDVVKLDASLTCGIDADPHRRALVAAMVSFARAAECTLVAEGIETPEELAAVRALGVDCGQGFHLGRPAVGIAERWLVELPRAHALRARITRVRSAQLAGVLAAAVLVFPAMIAVAGPKPDAGVQQRRPPATESRADSGGSGSAPAASQRPATAALPSASTAPVAASPVAPIALVPKPKPSAAPDPCATILCATVDGTVDAVAGVTSGVGDRVGGTVQKTKAAAGKLVGGTLRRVSRLLG
jgi:EAL domain-containing protein (putative c-di-GMP-specific phosphodiesterase class I)